MEKVFREIEYKDDPMYRVIKITNLYTKEYRYYENYRALEQHKDEFFGDDVNMASLRNQISLAKNNQPSKYRYYDIERVFLNTENIEWV